MQLQGWMASRSAPAGSLNQHASLLDEEHGLFVVAAGVGREADGERASQMFVEQIQKRTDELVELLGESTAAVDEAHRERVHEYLVRWINQINANIYGAGDGKMRTACDVLVVSANEAFIAHVGNGRSYLFRDGRAQQLTEDHTFERKIRRRQRKMRIGVEESVHNPHRYNSVLSRAVGGQPQVDVDTLYIDVRAGDRFLLCTDGVTESFEDEYLLSAQQSLDEQDYAGHLVEEALADGESDRATALYVAAPEGVGQYMDPDLAVETGRGMSFLRQVELFEGLEAPELMKVLRIVYKERFADGETIIERGEDAERMFMILDGEVSLRIDGEEIAQAGPGDHFGELALFSEGDRSADAVAVGEVELLTVPSDQFRTLVEVDELELGNKLFRNLLREAASRIRQTNMKLLAARDGDSTSADVQT